MNPTGRDALVRAIELVAIAQSDPTGDRVRQAVEEARHHGASDRLTIGLLGLVETLLVMQGDPEAVLRDLALMVAADD